MRGPRNRPPGLQNKEARGSFMKQPSTAADGDGQRSAGEDARSLKEQERSLTGQHPPPKHCKRNAHPAHIAVVALSITRRNISHDTFAICCWRAW